MEKLASRTRKMQPTTCIFLTMIKHETEQGVSVSLPVPWVEACSGVTQLPAGVATGGCVKRLFTEPCHSSYVLFMARKTEKTKRLLCFNFKAFVFPSFISVPQAVQPRSEAA